MKLALLSYTQKVGKTTIARHLLSPRVGSALTYRTQADTAARESDDPCRARELGVLLHAMTALENVIIEVAAHDTDLFLSTLRDFAGSKHYFDLFLVPALTTSAALKGAARTLEALQTLGVPEARLRIVMTARACEDRVADIMDLKSSSTYRRLLQQAPTVYFNRAVAMANKLGISLLDLHRFADIVMDERPRLLADIEDAKRVLDDVFNQLFLELPAATPQSYSLVGHPDEFDGDLLI